MELTLKRIAKRDTYTIGKLYVDGEYFCDTLEDKDRGLISDMSLVEIKKIKVKSKTAIPTGRYKVTMNMSTRFKKIMPQILNVPGFDGIRIHSGNTSADTEGCVLLGQNKVVGKVINSRTYTNKLYQIISDKVKKETIYITIE